MQELRHCPIAAGSFIKLIIDVNNSNSNCTLENEYLSDRPNSAEMSDSVSGHCTPLKNGQKRRDSKEVYNVRKKLIAVKEEQIKAMEQIKRNVTKM